MLCPIVKKSVAHCPQKIKEELVDSIIEFEEAEKEQEVVAALEEKKRLEALSESDRRGQMDFHRQFRDNFYRILRGQGQMRDFGKYYRTIEDFQ